jgi:calcineurin-like phosphoesterase
VLVVNALGRISWTARRSFAALEREIAACPLKTAADAIIVDMHAEASSEKQAMGFSWTRSASGCTHTRADLRSQVRAAAPPSPTNVGMTGDYDPASA